ncbi:MAG: hypothetical protein ABW223_05995 [Rariglobus sp.]
MKRLGLIVALTVLLAVGLRATSLGPDLSYIRAGTDVATATKSIGNGSAVLDLRYATDEAAAAPLFTAIKSAPANPQRILIVLLSPETSLGLRARLAGLSRILTVGRAATDFKTDIVVTTSSEADRRAFDALVAGTPPEKLMIENADKPRFDESTLVKEHATGIAAEHPTPSKTEADAPEKPLVDAVLQRAVHIHRGLVALRKI